MRGFLVRRLPLRRRMVRRRVVLQIDLLQIDLGRIVPLQTVLLQVVLGAFVARQFVQGGVEGCTRPYDSPIYHSPMIGCLPALTKATLTRAISSRGANGLTM